MGVLRDIALPVAALIQVTCHVSCVDSIISEKKQLSSRFWKKSLFLRQNDGFRQNANQKIVYSDICRSVLLAFSKQRFRSSPIRHKKRIEQTVFNPLKLPQSMPAAVHALSRCKIGAPGRRSSPGHIVPGIGADIQMQMPAHLLFLTKAVLIFLQQFSLLAAASDMQTAKLPDQIVIFCQNRIQDRLMAAVKIRRFPKTLKRGALIQVMDRI